jgi:hypothetical protein
LNTLFWSALFAILLVEFLALFFKLQFWRRPANAFELAILTISDAPDERAKEKRIVSAAFNLLGLVCYFWAILALIFLAITVLTDVAKLSESTFIWTTSAAVIAYLWLRAGWLERRAQKEGSANPSSSNPGYSRISRWLHWFALEISIIRNMSFELEKVLYLKKAFRDPRIIDQPLYVMGLARSGTTVVLEILEKTGAFHSTTYRDMPFVLCPNFWQGLTRRSRLNPRLATRAHDDGIVIGLDSPESFEEVFWRTTCETRPGPALAYVSPNEETLADFTAYRQLSVLSGLSSNLKESQGLHKMRYLSKNNNNVMRLNALSSQPGAQLVLVIRDPLATAWSLYRQNQRFIQLQTDDAFVMAYMRWLAHHEFGLSHKPLMIGTQFLAGMNPNQPDYWLAYWLGLYENLWQTFNSMPDDHRSRILWISHERMCQAPKEELERLFKFAKIDISADPFTSMLRPVKITDLTDRFDLNLAERARHLHREILHITKP